ncbi:MAG: hypothetical protein COA85_10295 [Robiginitomaculum sp.]|nr:MAG: hypothetical protein COA85_10295 [Robiginitomaculum sp.]
MAKPNKTQENDGNVATFLGAIENAQKREDCKTIAALMATLSGESAKMWGTAIIGFGRYHYRYDSGREGDSMRVGFSPRAQNISLYIIPGFDIFPELMAKLGKYKTGKSCLYIKKLSDIDVDVLRELIAQSLKVMAARYPAE